MPNSLMKLGPLAGFLAAVASCVWPYVSPPNPPAPEPSRMPKIEASWLKPQFPPSSDRDPFRGPGAPPAPPAIASAKPGGVAGGAGGPAGPGVKPAKPDATPDPGFRLGATLVAGGGRAAIIDGRVYRQGDRIETDTGPWSVESVEPGRVLLRWPKRKDPLVLELPDPSLAMADPGPQAPPPAEPGGLRIPGLGIGLDLASARAALAAAGVHVPAAGPMEQLAQQSGGSLSGAYRALLGVLIDPPKAAPPASGGGPRPEDGDDGRADR